jgi:MFS family permease
LSALVDRDFLIAFGSRLLVHTAIALNVIYLLFFLDLASDVSQALPGVRIEVVAGGLLTTSTVLSVIAGLVGGYVSDRLGRRRILVCIGSTLLAGGSLVMAVMPLWPGPLFAQALLGLGVGLYSTLDSVLMAEVLPSRPDTGQDLGLMNVAVTAAQMLAPSIGLIAVGHFSRDLQAVYLTGAVVALLGGAAVTIVRRVR